MYSLHRCICLCSPVLTFLVAFVFIQVCGKSFNRMYNLLGHMHLHAGSKPFKCPYCTSKFNLKGNLSRHMKVKHGMDVSPEGQGEARCAYCHFFFLCLTIIFPGKVAFSLIFTTHIFPVCNQSPVVILMLKVIFITKL